MKPPPMAPDARAGSMGMGIDDAVPPSAENEKGERVHVAVRMRPLSSREEKQGSAYRVDAKDGTILQTGADGSHKVGMDAFKYPHVFGPDTTNGAVYDRMRNVVDDVLRGYNGAIFAYGQTASGKTHTMRGEGGGEDGVVQMAARDIFRHVEARSSAQDVVVKASFVEVYNEKVRDLLVSSGGRSDLRVREGGDGFFVESEERVATGASDLIDIFNEGDRNRAVGSTGMNSRSSRSHAILRISVENTTKGDATISTLSLVDLAGSESAKHTGATGDRRLEGGSINKSLLVLSRVITVLGENSSGAGARRRNRREEPPYRESELTKVLKPSLSGNARVAVICCATPSAVYAEETKSTLQFAERAMMVETSAVKGRRRRAPHRASIASFAAPTKSSAAFATPKKSAMRRISATLSSLSPNRPRVWLRHPRTDVKAKRFSATPEEDDGADELRQRLADRDLTISGLEAKLKVAAEEAAERKERMSGLKAKLDEELRRERSETEWLRARVGDLESCVARLVSDRQFLEAEGEAMRSTSPRGAADVELGGSKESSERESKDSDQSVGLDDFEATEDFATADELKRCAPEDSRETILAELKRATGRAVELEALNLKLQRENEALTTRLASSNGRLLEFEALNLLEFEALNPNLLSEDELLAPLPEFPGAKESVGAGTSLSSQEESRLKSRADAKTKTIVPDDDPVPYSSGSGSAVDVKEDVTMRAKVPDDPEAEGPDIIDLTADAGDPTDADAVITRHPGPAILGKGHTDENGAYEPPGKFQHEDGLPHPSSNLADDGERFGKENSTGAGDDAGDEPAAAGRGECMTAIDESVGTVPDARRVPSFATVPSIGKGSQSAQPLGHNMPPKRSRRKTNFYSPSAKAGASAPCRNRRSARARRETDRYSPTSKAKEPTPFPIEAEEETDADFGCVGYRFSAPSYDGVVVDVLNDGRVLVDWSTPLDFGTFVMKLDDLPKTKPPTDNDEHMSPSEIESKDSKHGKNGLSRQKPRPGLVEVEKENPKPNIKALSRPRPQMPTKMAKRSQRKKKSTRKGKGPALFEALQELNF